MWHIVHKHLCLADVHRAGTSSTCTFGFCSSNRKRMLSFCSRPSHQIREWNASVLAIMRHEAAMHWLGLVTLCGRIQNMATASCFLPEGQRDQGCRSACQLSHIARPAKLWRLYHGCTAQLPQHLVQSFNVWINLYGTCDRTPRSLCPFQLFLLSLTSMETFLAHSTLCMAS
jgi:hypothetical protein